jgi:cysteine desulfurase
MAINYFDSASTTKVDSRVLEEMLPYFTEIYGNAPSNNDLGKIAKEAINKARNQVATLISTNDSEIIFTSWTTEPITVANYFFITNKLRIQKTKRTQFRFLMTSVN